MSVQTGVRRELSALWSDGKGPSLLAVALGWGLLNGARMVYPVVVPSLQTAYDLSLTVAGALISVLWLFAAVGQLPGGVLADRYDERTLMAVSTVAVAVALGLVVTSSSALLLFLATAMWGLSHSLFPIARITFLSHLYAGRLGTALGVTMATGDVGQTVLPFVATALVTGIAWQAGLGFVVPLLLVAAVGIVLTGSDRRGENRSAGTQSLRDSLGVLPELREPVMGFMTVILFLYMFIWQSFTAFFPTYLMSVKEFSPSVASLLFGFFFAVGVVVKPLAGVAYDRIGMRRSLVGILTPAVAGFVLLTLLSSGWLLVGVTALISTMLGTGAITQSFLADAFSDEMQGTGLGVVRTITASIAAGGPIVFGAVADRGFFDEGYLVLAGILTVVVVLTLRMPDAERV